MNVLLSAALAGAGVGVAPVLAAHLPPSPAREFARKFLRRLVRCGGSSWTGRCRPNPRQPGIRGDTPTLPSSRVNYLDDTN